MDRDCKNCVYSNMTEYTNGCTRWSCEYINIDEAVEAWKEKYGKKETSFCEFKGSLCDNCEMNTDCSWK